MSGLVDTVISWPTLGVALLVFGSAPGAVLRLLALAFHRDDPRRHELLAELHGVPRIERPFWVAEQVEVALFEGLWERMVWAATGRVIHRWHLRSGVEQNRKYPETFWIPDDYEKQAITPGMSVRLIFEMRDGWGERMWVTVDAMDGHRLVGTLDNQPVGIPRLDAGRKIKFTRDDIIDIWQGGLPRGVRRLPRRRGERPVGRLRSITRERLARLSPGFPVLLRTRLQHG